MGGEVHQWGPGGEAQLSRLEKEAFMSKNTHNLKCSDWS